MTDDRLDYNGLMRSDLYDRSGEKVGRIVELYAESAEGPPDWALVGMGFMRARLTFVPLDRIQQRKGEVQVPYSKEELEGAPMIEADREISQEEEEALFSYYRDLGYKRPSVGASLRRFLLGP